MGGNVGESGYRKDQVVMARVERIYRFGVFVRLPDGTEAYVRCRELSLDDTVPPEDVVTVGQEIKAVVVALAELGRCLELSVRLAEPDPWERISRTLRVRDTVTGVVKRTVSGGMLVQIVPGVDAFLPMAELAPWKVDRPEELLWVGDRVTAMITYVDWTQKHIQISIRQQMVHEARVSRIAGRFQPLVETAVPEPEPAAVGDPKAEAVDLEPLGKVLVVDDHPTVRGELVVWLQHQGCKAEGVDELDKALRRVQEESFKLAVVDLDLGGQDGLELVRRLPEISPLTQVIVMSIPEWIAERSAELEALRVIEAFAKPLNLREILDVLGRLIRNEPVAPFRAGTQAQAGQSDDSFRRLARSMRSSESLTARLQSAVSDLVRYTRAQLGVLFHLDQDSQQISVVTQAGELALNAAAVYDLWASPVRDVILFETEVFESDVSARSRRFDKLRVVVNFLSCLGVPVPAAGRVEHALFLFHGDSQAFSGYRLRDARATAVLLGIALESRALESRIEEISPFLLTGQLAAGFGHDVYNKMSALELQVINLCAGNGGREAEGAPAPEELSLLLETTRDLKQTVEAFRELLRAEAQAKVDVNQVVRRAVSMLRTIARREQVRIKTDLAQDLPQVAGSAMRLQQAVLNVMLNAIQQIGRKRQQWADTPAELLVTTSVHEEPRPGPGFERGAATGTERPVFVRFVDTGPGIHRRMQENIFALGFSTRPGGTGLGLFIVRSLIESMMGRVVVEESTIPMGTAFRIDLPISGQQG